MGSTNISQPAPPPPPPTPPSPAAQTRDAIQAEIELLPRRLETELRFRPQFAAADIDILREFGPEAAEIFAGIQETQGPRLAAAERALQEQLFPERFAAERALSDRIQRTLGEGLDPVVEERFRERVRGEEARSGRLGSSVGDINVARELAFLESANEAQAAAEALSLSGRIPTISSPNVPVGSPSAQPTLTGSTLPSQLALGGQLANAQAAVFGTQGRIFGSQLGAFSGQQQQRRGFLGSISPIAGAIF